VIDARTAGIYHFTFFHLEVIMPRDLGIPLRDVLAHPCFKEAKLVAGASGIDKLVKYVNVMEVPDIIDWVKRGELLLTTVFAIRNDEGALSRLIPDLAAKGLAGLAIKPGRYIEKIPDVMLQQADASGLPLIELPLDTSFSDIINPIASAILDHQAAILKRADEVHAKFSQVVLDGGSLPEIAATLSELLRNNRVEIENSLGEVVAQAPEETLKKTEGTARKPQEPVGGASQKRKEAACAKRDIRAGKKFYGRLTVYETDYKLSDRDEITIERAAMVAALEMVNRLAVTAVEMRYYNEFVNEVLVADLAEERTLRQRGKDLGIDLARSHTVAVIHILTGAACGGENGEDEDGKLQILQHVVQGLRDKFADAAVGYKHDSILLFLPRPGRGGATAENYRQQIQTIQQFVQDKVSGVYPLAQVLIGAGRPGSGLAELQSSYREAVRAYQLGRTVWPSRQVLCFADLGVYRLLGNADESELRAFVQETIGPVLAYDKKKDSELLKTLEQYFECQGNLKKVSETMFVHYNTVLYRLDRITELTEIDLDDANARLNLHVGLKALKLLETSCVDLIK
jgi:purine catabolism regulator